MTDFPDYTQYAAIDIFTQTLDRILNRPTYGGALTSAVTRAVTANDDTLLMSVAGEGMLYGGLLIVDAGMTQEDSLLFPILDLNSQAVISFGSIIDLGFVRESGVTPIVCNYDDVNNVYSFALPWGITFETSFSMLYREAHGDTPTVTCIMYYALV